MSSETKATAAPQPIDPKLYLAARPKLAALEADPEAWGRVQAEIGRFVSSSRSFEQLMGGLNLLLLGLSLAK